MVLSTDSSGYFACKRERFAAPSVWKAGERGQVVIPKEARDLFDIKPGDKLVVLGEEGQGLAFCKEYEFMANVEAAMAAARKAAK